MSLDDISKGFKEISDVVMRFEFCIPQFGVLVNLDGK